MIDIATMTDEQKIEYALTHGVRHQLISADFETLHGQVINESFVINKEFDPNQIILNSTDEAMTYLETHMEITNSLLKSIRELEKSTDLAANYGMSGQDFQDLIKRLRKR